MVSQPRAKARDRVASREVASSKESSVLTLMPCTPQIPGTTQKIHIYFSLVYYDYNSIRSMHCYTCTYYYAYYETYIKCRIFFLYSVSWAQRLCGGRE